MQQSDFRMPATGEVWRHYKGGLYTVIGMARDDKGDAQVVYTDYRWHLVQLPPIYTQSIARFMQEVENNKPRFVIALGCGTNIDCAFIKGGPR